MKSIKGFNYAILFFLIILYMFNAGIQLLMVYRGTYKLRTYATELRTETISSLIKISEANRVESLAFIGEQPLSYINLNMDSISRWESYSNMYFPSDNMGFMVIDDDGDIVYEKKTVDKTMGSFCRTDLMLTIKRHLENSKYTTRKNFFFYSYDKEEELMWGITIVPIGPPYGKVVTVDNITYQYGDVLGYLVSYSHIDSDHPWFYSIRHILKEELNINDSVNQIPSNVEDDDDIKHVYTFLNYDGKIEGYMSMSFKSYFETDLRILSTFILNLVTQLLVYMVMYFILITLFKSDMHHYYNVLLDEYLSDDTKDSDFQYLHSNNNIPLSDWDYEIDPDDT